MTTLTKLVNNDARCMLIAKLYPNNILISASTTFGLPDNTKYAGFIYKTRKPLLSKEGFKIEALLFSTDYIFDSKDEALSFLTDLCEECVEKLGQ